MKKLFALLAVVLAVVSCQKDVDLDVNVGGDIAKISVALPNDAITRAGGTDSAKGGLTNTSNEVVRVILQVYYNGEASSERLVEYLGDGETVANFDVRLVPDRVYTFVAWADQVEAETDKDLYYNTENLKAVTMMPRTWSAMDERRDAYTHTLTETFTASANLDMTLTRPFAKLRIKTTDMQHLRKVGIEPTTATISYTTKHYTTFNAFAGEAVDKENAGVAHEYTIATYSNETGNEKTLYADYFFASAEEEVVNFTFAVRDQKGEQIKQNTFNTSIPVKRNHLTTIAGNILTENNNFDVTLDEEFDGENNFSVKTIEELKAALNVPGATITLENDLTISEKITIKNNVTINGGNKTLTYTGSGASARAIDCPDNNVNVAISNLNIVCTASYCQRGINFNNAGTLTLNNVKVSGTNVTYALNLPGSSDNCEVEINNCELTANIALNVWGENTVINVNNSILTSVDKSTAEGYDAVKLNNDGETSAEYSIINIVGGKVIARDENGNPSTATENNTVYGQINISDSTEVVGNHIVAVAIATYKGSDQFYSFTSLKKAIEKAVETSAEKVVLLCNIELEEPITIANDQTVTIDLNGYTVSSFDNSEAGYALITNNGNLTITGEGALTITGANTDRGTSAFSSVISTATNSVLVVDKDVTIWHQGGTYMAYGIDVLTNSGIGEAHATIYGKVKSAYRAVRQFLNCDSKMNTLIVKEGAVLEGANKSIFFQDPSKKANLGTLVVENGATLNGDVYLYVTEGSTEWPVEVTIADSALAGESKITSKNVPDGYKIELNEDGNWVVNLDLMPFKGTTNAPVPGLYVKAGEPNTILVKNVTNKSTDVNSAAGLAWIAANAAEYNGFADYTIKLLEDIDCFKGYMDDGDPVTTRPIGQRDHTGASIGFKGVFDGDGHSIKNLYQNGWALGYESGVYGAIGLFARVEGATVKNLTMEGCEMFVEGGNVAVIAGNAEGDCTFENITIKNSTVCSYNNGAAGIVAWSETGNYTFKNIVLEDTFTVASFWGFHGAFLGGVVAEAYDDCSYKFEDIVINCRLDAYNDVVSNYQWYAYRCEGMIVGNVETTQQIGDTVYPNPAGCGITCKNVTVNYGDWMNYHYCESPEFGTPSYAKEGQWKFKRVEPGYSYGGIDYTNCKHGEMESHYEYIPFDQLFGGGPNTTGHNPVYGLASYEGVTVNYPASYVREN